MADYAGALDQGTTSTRFMVFDHQGKVVSIDQKEHEQIYPRPGWVEHNAKEIWDRCQDVIAGALSKANLSPSDLAAVGVTNQRETTVVWDRNTGEPVHNAVVWQDTRTDVICNELAANGGQDRFRGTLIHSGVYRNADRFAGQRVLVVGAGNTGAEIALDLAEHGARPTMALRSPVNIVPRDFLGIPTHLTSIRIGRLPLAVRDRIGRVVSRLAFGNLTRHGFARPEIGPLSAFELRGRVPLIDVGTIAAVKRGEIAVKPAVVRFTETGATFADGSTGNFDAVVLATGYRPALEEIVTVPGVLADGGYPRDWKGGSITPNLFFVGYKQPATGLLRQIAIEAEAVADAIAGTNARR